MHNHDDRLKDLIAEQAAEWYVANREGPLDMEQRQQFLQWLRTSPLHVQEYLGIASLGRDLPDALGQTDAPSLDALLAEATQGGEVIPLGAAAAAKTPSRRRGPGLRPIALGGAALAAALAIGITILLPIWRTYAGHLTYSTRHGEQRTVQLADNTVLHLDSDSAVALDYDRHHRIVDVRRGQVYFDVAKDPGHPFRVIAGNTVIQDIGTVFNVFRHRTHTTVTVVEGQVRIWDRSPAAADPVLPLGQSQTTMKPLADLTAGKRIEVAASGRVDAEGPANLREVTAWVHQEIVFDHQSIAAVAADFNRYNQIQIQVEDPGIATIPISGVFHTYDVGAFAQFLNDLPGVRASKNGQVLVVTGRAKSPTAS